MILFELVKLWYCVLGFFLLYGVMNNRRECWDMNDLLKWVKSLVQPTLDSQIS